MTALERGAARRAGRIAAGVASLLMLGIPAARAGLVPGGGPRVSDCYAELDVVGVENGTDALRNGRQVRCLDGDPCDAGPCGDAVCDFQVRLCWNQDDPNLPECIPPVGLDTLELRGSLAALLVMPRSMDRPSCSEGYVSLPVPTRRNGTKPGKVNVRLRVVAPDGTTPRTDTDFVKLVCVPRPVEECPFGTTTTTPGATTTTSTAGTAVTTTSTTTRPTTTTKPPKRPKPSTTTTTLRRPPTTSSSTTAPVPTTTIVVPTTTTTTLVGSPSGAFAS